MSLFSALSESIRVTTDLARSSVERIRLEAKLKSLERRQAQALAALGRRVRELTLSGDLTDDRLTEEIAEVAAAEMRIAACEAEIEEVSVAPASSRAAEATEDAASAVEPDDDDDDDAAKAIAEAAAEARGEPAPSNAPPAPDADTATTDEATSPDETTSTETKPPASEGDAA